MSKIPVATASHVRSSQSNTCSPTNSLNSSANISFNTIHSPAVNLGNEHLIQSPPLPVTSKCVYNQTTDTKNLKNIDSVINSHLPKLTKDFISTEACNFNNLHPNSIESTVRYKRTKNHSNLPVSRSSNVTTRDDYNKDDSSNQINSPCSVFNYTSCSSSSSPHPSRNLVPNCEATTPIVTSIHSRNESPTSPNVKSPPKFEAFMMTGDLMINLASKQTTDNPLALNNVSNIPTDIFGVNTSGVNNKRLSNQRKFNAQQQSLKYQSSNLPVKLITTSLPSSPESVEKQRDKFISHHETPQPSRKTEQDDIQSTDLITTPIATNVSPLHKQKTFAVRLSKSQHELQDFSLSPSPSNLIASSPDGDDDDATMYSPFDRQTIECNTDNVMFTLECDKDVTLTKSDISAGETIENTETIVNRCKSVSPRGNDLNVQTDDTGLGGNNDTFSRNVVTDDRSTDRVVGDATSSSSLSISSSFKSSTSESSSAAQSNVDSDTSTVKSTSSSVKTTTGIGNEEEARKQCESNGDQDTGAKVECAKRYPSFIGSTVSDDDDDDNDDDLNIDLKCDSTDSTPSKSPYTFSPPKAVDYASASRLARRLFDLQGFKKCDISRHLSKNNDFSKAVAEEYLRLFDFTDDRVDCALRKFLVKFNLVGETDERERVLIHFSKRLLQCNQDSYKSVDAIHTLTCALMLLNTDLHSESVGRRMTLSQFIENLSGLHDGSHFNQDLLKALYFSIKNQPLQWAHDEDESGATKLSCNGSNLTSLLSGSDLINDTSGKNLLDQSINPFLGISSGGKLATEYKKGYLLRKCCYDCNGKKTPIGKRRWKNFYATLRDLVLYLHKDETGFRKNQLYESLKNSIRIHHALASKATDYVKKDFVFRLHTADQAEYLFKASDAHEMQSWIDSINFAAASLSAPPLAPAVGSEQKFNRPLLPVSHTKLNMREQLIEHEERIATLEQELEAHLDCPPERSTLKRSLNDYTEKQLYLQFELKRYRIYSQLLKNRLVQSMGPQALEKAINAAKCIPMSSSKCKPLISLPIEENDGDTEEDK